MGRSCVPGRSVLSVRASWVLIRIFPRKVCEFVDGISAIREAYQSRDLTYSVIVAEK